MENGELERECLRSRNPLKIRPLSRKPAIFKELSNIRPFPANRNRRQVTFPDHSANALVAKAVVNVS